MKRYTVNFGPQHYGVFVDEHGEYVRHSDHQAALAEAVAKEQEACAKIAEDGKNEYIALYIRARGATHD
jgi:hypothetical protein